MLPEGVPYNRNAVPVCNLHDCRLITPISGLEYDDGQGFADNPTEIERGLSDRMPDDGLPERRYTRDDMVELMESLTATYIQQRILRPGEYIHVDYTEDWSDGAPYEGPLYERRIPEGEIRWMVRIKSPGSNQTTR